MRPRRVALLLMAVLATATGSLGANAARAADSSGSSAQKICVALVVDGRSLGSNVSTTCAKVARGSSGVDVLQAAGHRLTFRSDGLLCAIDGLPKSGCSAVDDTHYWAYFHRAPGSKSWVYSNDNESTYEPANKSTEGWAYRDGKLLPPENVPYTSICKPQPTPTPSPTRTHHRSPKPTHAASAPPSPGGRHRSAPTASPSSSVSPSHPAHHTAQHHRARRHHHGNGLVNLDTETRVTHTPQPSPSSAALVGGNPPSSSNHNWLAVVIGIIVIAALGGLAALRFRRSE